MRHRRWLETISIYQCKIKYHSGKVNLVANALSHKLKMRDERETSKVDSLLEEIRHLLVKDRSPGEVLSALQQLRISDF